MIWIDIYFKEVFIFNFKFQSYNVTINHAILYFKKKVQKDEMNLYLISEPLVINFYFQQSSVKMAELYQTKDTTTVHIKMIVFVIKMSLILLNLKYQKKNQYFKNEWLANY